ncbi:uncharacterized protein LOC119670039 [Teleopsis dalmanni]|uniref:uncharacterized protein LOC119670039 n=1 Tax=Teleopsis dalmanni TaxID=139649 RepID=UPI0018CC85CC|nr:uncharacterized protein LOC119670039 [Teleopsis dalmanni]
MFSSADVAKVRHVVQRILVPCVFVIGLLGNSVSIYVLTRRRMRCTTNIYLTALAITDIIYLTMALLLSLQHYENVQYYESYWMYYGTVVWLCDACAYISIYIAVCFTIERFIAIRYPLKRQTFCTESLAKKVITGVALFCILSTISTAFEHEYRSDTKLIDSQGGPCNLTLMNAKKTLDFDAMWPFTGNEPVIESVTEADIGAVAAIATPTEVGSKIETVKIKRNASIDMPSQHVVIQRRESATHIPTTMATTAGVKATTMTATTTAALLQVNNRDDLLDADFLGREYISDMLHMQMKDTTENGYLYKDVILEGNDSVKFDIADYCRNVTYFKRSSSSLLDNGLYTRIWYPFTLFVFVLIPLCVLVTFNCFLIMLVRRSKNLRGEMTNASSMRRPKRKSNISSVSQENRVTVTLIAVVLLFIICQLPWAIYLIVLEHMQIDANLQKIIGNVFNFLAAINAAANFFLYCVLSDKYRKTVRELITGYKYRPQRSIHTNASQYTHTNMNAANGSRRYRETTTSLVIK